jgi:predicted regulator of Ras-like GTPase activity (Roadblock/LC7/MglB family)
MKADAMNINQLQFLRASSRLQKYMEDCKGMYGMLVSTVDGNEVMHVVEREIPTDRLAAMNSSMLALAETLARESSQKLCRFVILENSDGRIVNLRVNDTLLLTCVSNKDSNLGIVLNTGQNAANDLAEIF